VEKDTVPPSILVVDDEEGIRTTLCEIIRRSGHTAFGVSSAEEALDFLEGQQVDVMITDIMMSGRNGLELTDIVKKKYDCDVIIITGYGGDFSYEEALEKGASDFAQKPVRGKEIIARLKRILKERSLVNEQKEMEKRLRELTITDDLTKLFNSRHFFKQIQSEIARSSRYQHPLSLLLLDVDRFKHYNDTYGHLEGDKVLAKLGEVILACLRKNDSGYRYGGDEFTVILPETPGTEAVKVAERIRQGFSAVSFSPEPQKDFSAAVSIGVAQRQGTEEWEGLTKRADEAMYQAKRQGGNQTVLL